MELALCPASPGQPRLPSALHMQKDALLTSFRTLHAPMGLNPNQFLRVNFPGVSLVRSGGPARESP